MPPLSLQQAYDLALQHHRAGRMAEAEALYRQILAAQPDHADTLHFLGVAMHQRGSSGTAAQLIERAIFLQPHSPAACANLGEVYRALGRLDEAVASFRRALEMAPNEATTWSNLGNALREKGRYPEAVEACQRAIQLNPNSAEAWNSLGLVFADQNRFDEALSAYRQAIERRPDYPQAYLNLGQAHSSRGEQAEAIAAYREAIARKPDYALAYNNLGVILSERGELDAAIDWLRQAVSYKPDFAEAHNSLGAAFAKKRLFEEAIQAYRRALQLRPDYVEAYNNLGSASQSLGKLDQAIEAFQHALRLRPAYAEAMSNLGDAFRRGGQLDKAMETYESALRLKPDLPEAHNNLGYILKEQGRLDEALAAYRRAWELRPGDAATGSNLIYTLEFHPRQEEAEILREQEHWNRLFSPAGPRPVFADRHGDSAERRLRIGYVSADFRQHVIGANLWPLLRHHDHQSFEVFCYSGVISPDAMTETFRQQADHWRSTLDVPDEALAEMIRQDRIDILVDLTQHLSGNRLPAFARTSAPVRVSFAGYPASTGVAAIPYRISDRWLERAEASPDVLVKARDHEQVFLIDSFWCYNPRGAETQVSALPAETAGAVTFGSLNNFCKINPPLLRLWARVLNAVPNSRLLILSYPGAHQQRTMQFLEGEGIAAHRVEFLAPRPRAEYLELYHRLDIALDPFPYNGHTTSLDALWMGVPVISLAGDRPVSRAGLSQLSNLGLPDLVAASEAQYVDLAARLAGDLPRLKELRATLRSRLEKSVLMDAPHFTRQIEEAYRAMWRQWCARQLPGK